MANAIPLLLCKTRTAFLPCGFYLYSSVLLFVNHLPIGPAPVRHSVDNGVHGFAQLAQRIFHARRHFRINRAHNNAVLFH